MSFFGTIARNIRRVFSPKQSQAPSQSVAPSAPSPPPRANVLTKAAQSRTRNPLTASISRSQSVAPPTAFNSNPFSQASSGGGGGGGGGRPTPRPQPSQSFAPQAAPEPVSPFVEPELGSPSESQTSNFGLDVGDLPAGAQFNASAIDKLSFGLDVAGAGFATKGATLTNAFVKQIWKQKGAIATQKALAEVSTKAAQLARGEGVEGLVKILERDARRKSLDQIGKAAINTKNVRKTITYLSKIAEAAKNPKVVLGILISSLTIGAGSLVMTRFMNSNVKGDLAQDLNRLSGEALRSGDPEIFEEVSQMINDTNVALREADGVLGDWSLLKYSKGETKKWTNLLEANQVRAKIFEKDKQEEESNTAYWEDIRQIQADRDAQYEERRQEDALRQQEQNDFILNLQQQKQDAALAQDRRREKEFDRRLAKEQADFDRRNKLITERDALLQQQRLMEWETKIKEFNRQQKIFMENWNKRQKYYQEQRGSNLGFGLLQ